MKTAVSALAAVAGSTIGALAVSGAAASCQYRNWSSCKRQMSAPAATLYASTILCALHDAETELVGKAVVLSDGKAGTVELISLDESHGLRISIRGHPGKWPISTIKFAQR